VRRPGDAQQRIEREILAEKASALGRAGERLEEALREAADLAARVRGAPAGERGPLLVAYREIRARALRLRTFLLIQREALGLRRHAVVDAQYPEPPELAEFAGGRPEAGPVSRDR
jgi:hypothetical protein